MSNEKIDNAYRKLLGTWRSDQEKTVQNWVFPKRLAAQRLKAFHSIFGKNTWRFTKQFCFAEFEGLKSRARYEILWAGDSSAVVLFRHKDSEFCHHLFFEGDYFYLSAGKAGNVEYFKRIF